MSEILSNNRDNSLSENTMDSSSNSFEFIKTEEIKNNNTNSDTPTITKYQCNICNDIFNTNEKVTKHLHLKHNDDIKKSNCKISYFINELFKCNQCKMTVKRDEHICINNNIKGIDPFTSRQRERKCQCLLCSNFFATTASVSKHIRNIHKNCTNLKSVDMLSKPVYRCVYCKLIVLDKQTYKNHICCSNDKTKMKRYLCNLCKRHFGTHLNVVSHIKKMHKTSKKLVEIVEIETYLKQCKKCYKLFPNNTLLNKHITSNCRNLEIIVCNICNEGFIKENDVNSEVLKIKLCKHLNEKVMNEIMSSETKPLITNISQCEGCLHICTSESKYKEHVMHCELSPNKKPTFDITSCQAGQSTSKELSGEVVSGPQSFLQKTYNDQNYIRIQIPKSIDSNLEWSQNYTINMTPNSMEPLLQEVECPQNNMIILTPEYVDPLEQGVKQENVISNNLHPILQGVQNLENNINSMAPESIYPMASSTMNTKKRKLNCDEIQEINSENCSNSLETVINPEQSVPMSNSKHTNWFQSLSNCEQSNCLNTISNSEQSNNIDMSNPEQSNCKSTQSVMVKITNKIIPTPDASKDEIQITTLNPAQYSESILFSKNKKCLTLYQCVICYEWKSSKSEIEEHIKIKHKNYESISDINLLINFLKQCSNCKLKFNTNVSMYIFQNHICCSDGQIKLLNYICKKCGGKLLKNCNLVRHSKLKHNSELQMDDFVPVEPCHFQCKICFNLFNCEQSLLKHSKFSCKANNLIICEKCGKRLKPGKYFIAHKNLNCNQVRVMRNKGLDIKNEHVEPNNDNITDIEMSDNNIIEQVFIKTEVSDLFEITETSHPIDNNVDSEILPNFVKDIKMEESDMDIKSCLDSNLMIDFQPPVIVDSTLTNVDSEVLPNFVEDIDIKSCLDSNLLIDFQPPVIVDSTLTNVDSEVLPNFVEDIKMEESDIDLKNV